VLQTRAWCARLRLAGDCADLDKSKAHSSKLINTLRVRIYACANAYWIAKVKAKDIAVEVVLMGRKRLLHPPVSCGEFARKTKSRKTNVVGGFGGDASQDMLKYRLFHLR
jgi:hypothetical protein